jgi:hypothetical protein
MDMSDGGFISLALAGGSALSLFDVAKGLPTGVSAEPGGCELDIEVEDLDAAYQDWQAKGVTDLGEIFSIGIGRQFYGKDPDGHCLAIYHLDQPLQ